VSRDARFVGVSVTALVHGALAVLFVARGGDAGCGGRASADAAARFENAETIEAALAFKEVKPQSNQPQKQRKKKYRPDNAPVVHNPDAPERPPPPDHKVKVEKEEIDIESILEKNRAQNIDLSSTGVDELPKEGSADGSEWGSEREAKGHPYAGELKGRIKSVWQVPALETGGGVAEGCVKLDRSGKIVDRFVKKKSGNANLDRSVETALNEAPDMEDPVPDDLVDLVTVKGICFRFTLTGN